MRRNLVYISVVFLAGMLAGALAVGGYEQISQSSEGASGERVSADEGTVSRFKGGQTDLEARNALVLSAESENLSAGSPDLSAATARLEATLREMSVGWTRLQGELVRLQGRVVSLEQRLAAAALPAGRGDELKRPGQPNTPEDRRSVLVKSGVETGLAADLVWRQDQNELDRLELRDLAIREGWFRSDRYRKEVRRLNEERLDLRGEVGDEIYDRYLFAAGHDNRVRVTSVIAGSPAESVGMQPGDVVDSYAGEWIFSINELRSATAAGVHGELVPVQLRHADGSRGQIWLPRGPLGTRMELTRADPDG